MMGEAAESRKNVVLPDHMSAAHSDCIQNSALPGRSDVPESGSAEDTLQSDLTNIERAIERAIILTRQLLTFSRKQEAMPQLIDLNQKIIDNWKILDRLMGENITFHFTPDHSIGKILASEGLIEQILANLVVVSCDAMPHKGQINIKTAGMRILLKSRAGDLEPPPGKYVLLQVADTGGGTSEELLSQVFKPSVKKNEVHKIFDFGLSTVNRMVKQNNGYFNVHSRPKVGTTYKIYFPIAE